MYQIQTLNKISPLGLKLFEQDKFQCSDRPENPEAILVRSAAMHDMEFGSNLLAIGRAGAGVNNIPLPRCSEQGIVVFNTPGANANAVKELVLTGMLISSRKVVDGINWAKTLEGDSVPAQVEKGKSSFVGPELNGKNLGVIGLGAIGAMVANTATHLGMSVYGYDPFITVASAWRLSRSVMHSTSQKAVFENSDYITLHVPVTADTKGMIGKEAFAQMKDGVRLLNFSRGELVNEDALEEALESGKVACYVTDFPNERVLKMKNVIAIPHLGASTPEAEDNCAMMAVRQVSDYLLNGNITNSVNFPVLSAERTTQTRVCIIHKNIPNMITKFTAAFGEHQINIDQMLSKGRNDIAYAILDVDTEQPVTAIEETIKGIEGVIRYRIIK